MPKLKDFLQKTFEQGNVRGDDVAALLGASALSELEIPDTAVAKFNESYLTRERAENDPELVKKIKLTQKAEILDVVDKELEKLYPLIDSTKAGEIAKNQNTFKKIELLTGVLDEAIKNGKVTTDKSVQKVEEEWSLKLKKEQEDRKAEVALVKKMNEENNLNFALKSKLLTFEYADAFSDMKDALAETIIGKVKGTKTKEGNQIVFEVDPTGTLNVRQNLEGTLRDVYLEGNEKLTIDKLIAPHVDKFLKKSNGKGGDTTQTTTKTTTKPVDTNGMSLHDRMWAGQK